MFRLSATQDGPVLDVWLFDDHAEEHDGDHNLVTAWEDLLVGASSVAVEWCFVTRDEDGNIVTQSPWGNFSVSLAKPQGYAKRVLRGDLSGIPTDREYLLRFSIDSGPWFGPISFRFG